MPPIVLSPALGAAEDAIVMASPVPWETVTRPGGNAPWAFFGDRRLLTTDYEWGLIFAHHVSEPKIDARHARQLAIFAGDVDAVALA